MYGFCAPSAVDLPLNHIVVHPKYDSKTFGNNIALLILKEPLNFSGIHITTTMIIYFGYLCVHFSNLPISVIHIDTICQVVQ